MLSKIKKIIFIVHVQISLFLLSDEASFHENINVASAWCERTYFNSIDLFFLPSLLTLSFCDFSYKRTNKSMSGETIESMMINEWVEMCVNNFFFLSNLEEITQLIYYFLHQSPDVCFCIKFALLQPSWSPSNDFIVVFCDKVFWLSSGTNGSLRVSILLRLLILKMFSVLIKFCNENCWWRQKILWQSWARSSSRKLYKIKRASLTLLENELKSRFQLNRTRLAFTRIKLFQVIQSSKQTEMKLSRNSFLPKTLCNPTF